MSAPAAGRGAVRGAALVTAGLLAACTPGPPDVGGVRGVAPSPGTRWEPPSRVATAPPPPAAAPALPLDLAQRIGQLTLGDIIDVALRNNTATRVSWANARAAAATYGAARGSELPRLDAAFNVTRLKSIASQGRVAAQQTVYGPSVTLSYLLFDFGGRAGVTDQARQALFAADWTHNATLQTAVLQVESAYYGYLATRGLLEGERTTLKETEASLAAAEDRHRVGLATIADVLQARTAVSQARLAFETTEGALQTARGALAVSMGLPANLPYDVAAPAESVSVAMLQDSVNTLIDQALANRPDLAAARAEFARATAAVRAARAASLPSLTLGGNAARTFISTRPGGTTYTLTLGLQVPLFDGFTRAYQQSAAVAAADAAEARAESLRQQVIYQVFSSYYALQTAARRVRTADDLLASATQSADVALGRYREGVGTVLDLLSAQAALADARAQQGQARWIWATALAQLAHDAGVLDTRGTSPLRLVPDSTPPTP